MGSSALPLILLMSLVHSGLSQVKPVVTVTPDQRVFSGETVTLRCVIQGGGCIQWRYGWMKDGHIYPFITPTADYSFTADVSRSGEYSCRGERSDSYTDYSDGVTLTVSDKPQPTLTVEPQSSVFTGDTVTLSCDVGRSTGWTFHWTKDSNWESSDAGTKTISSVKVSDGGTYWCIAQRGDSYTEYSNAIQITVRERPKPVVEVKPDVRVFRGETVTLTCVIQETGVWTYSWYKDQDNSRRSDQIYHSAGQHQIYIITSVDSSHAGLYRCRGTQTETPQYSEFSDGVTLTVSGLPSSTVTVTPAGPVFTGETVNLQCVINSDHSNWRYEWYKDSVILQTYDRYTVNTDTLTIRGVTGSDQGQYWCKGQRDGRPNSSTSSSAVSLSVMDLQPKPELTSDPAGAALTGNTVTLTCHMDLTTGDWDYYWYKHTLNPETEKKKTHSYRLKIDSVSDGGQYWCRAGRGKPVYYTQCSDALWVNVTDGEVILESSVDPVIEGQTLTLHCLHRYTNSPISSADFYKDGSLIQNQTTGEMSITTVSKSHEGFYSCKTERGQSPRCWISVTEVFNDQISDLKIFSFLLAASPYLLATVVLLFKCYRARVSSAEDQSQYAVTEE